MPNEEPPVKSENWFEKHRVLSVVGAFIIFLAVISAINRTDQTPGASPEPTTLTEQSSSTRAPTPTPPEPAKPINLSGTGQTATSMFELTTGLATAKLTHQSDGHFSAWLLDSEGERIELLANDSGKPFDGSKAFRVPADGQYVLDISADGPWAIDITQ